MYKPRPDAMQELIARNRQEIIDRLIDGATIPQWARTMNPDVGMLEALAELEKQVRMQSSINSEAQPQDVATLNNQPQDRAWVNNLAADTVGAFGLGVGKMMNDTLVGGTGYGLGLLGRGVEAISPFSGLDKEATRRLERLRALGITSRMLPSTRVYRDSWLTSGAKATLGLHNSLEDFLNELRTKTLGENPSRIAELFEGSGSSFGFMLSRAALASNPLTALLIHSGLEALSEAGGFMGDAYRNGQYDNGALGTATNSFASNFILNAALDRLTSRLSPYVQGIGNPYVRRIAEGASEVLNEILQEPSQHVIEQAATNSLNNGTGFLPELGESAKEWPAIFKELAPSVAGSTALTEILLGIGGMPSIRRANINQRGFVPEAISSLERQKANLQNNIDNVYASGNTAVNTNPSSFEMGVNPSNEDMDINPDYQSDVQDTFANNRADAFAKAQGIDEQIRLLKEYANSKPSWLIDDTPQELYDALAKDTPSLFTDDEWLRDEEANDNTSDSMPNKGEDSSPLDDLQDLENITQEETQNSDIGENNSPLEDLEDMEDVEGTASSEEQNSETPLTPAQEDRQKTIPFDGNNTPNNHVPPSNSYTPTNIQGSNTARIRTMQGTEVDVRYRIVDVDDLITSTNERGAPNPAYPQELQPRQRNRAASFRQIDKIASHIDPEMLGANRMASDGAPVIGSDLAVESGNGRVMGLRKAYQIGKAENYRAWLRDNAEMFGLKAEDITRVRNPVLVRERTSDVDRVKFTSKANESSIASMSAAEHAMDDAKKLTPELLSRYDVESSFEANKTFINSVIFKLPANERGDLQQSDGRISQAGYERVRNALAAKAYNDAGILSRLSELFDDEIKNISNALIQGAPKMAIFESSPRRPEISLRNDIVQAVNILANLKKQKKKVIEYITQPPLFDDEISPAGKKLLAFFDRNRRSAKRIAQGLIRYAELGLNEATPNQTVLFEDSIRTKESMLDEAISYAENPENDITSSDSETYNQSKGRTQSGTQLGEHVFTAKIGNRDYSFRVKAGEFSDKHDWHKKFFGRYLELQDMAGRIIGRFSPYFSGDGVEFSKYAPKSKYARSVIEDTLAGVGRANIRALLHENGFLDEKGRVIDTGDKEFRKAEFKRHQGLRYRMYSRREQQKAVKQVERNKSKPLGTRIKEGIKREVDITIDDIKNIPSNLKNKVTSTLYRVAKAYPALRSTIYKAIELTSDLLESKEGKALRKKIRDKLYNNGTYNKQESDVLSRVNAAALMSISRRYGIDVNDLLKDEYFDIIFDLMANYTRDKEIGELLRDENGNYINQNTIDVDSGKLLFLDEAGNIVGYDENGNPTHELLDDLIAEEKSENAKHLLLSEVFDAPELYKAYPTLQDAIYQEFALGSGIYGTFSIGAYNNGFFTINNSLNNNQVRSVLIYQIQKAIQEIEGYSNIEQSDSPNIVAIANNDVNETNVARVLEGTLRRYAMSIYTGAAPALRKKFTALLKQSKTLSKAQFADLVRDTLKKNERKLFRKLYNALREAERYSNSRNVKDLLSKYTQFIDLSNEAEARNVQQRRDWDAGKRRTTIPELHRLNPDYGNRPTKQILNEDETYSQRFIQDNELDAGDITFPYRSKTYKFNVVATNSSQTDYGSGIADERLRRYRGRRLEVRTSRGKVLHTYYPYLKGAENWGEEFNNHHKKYTQRWIDAYDRYFKAHLQDYLRQGDFLNENGNLKPYGNEEMRKRWDALEQSDKSKFYDTFYKDEVFPEDGDYIPEQAKSTSRKSRILSGIRNALGNSESIRRTNDSFITPERYDQLVYHATGNTILGNKFDLQYIGNGNGARLYGWGIYFSDSKEDVNKYRKAGLKSTDTDKHGNLYVADIPENNMLLNWNAKISEQSNEVQQCLRRAIARAKQLGASDNALRKLQAAKTGEDFYHALETIMPPLLNKLSKKGISSNDMAASLLLNQAGIPGLYHANRYLDNTTLKTKTNRNFVVWNTDMMKILSTSNDSDLESKFAFKSTKDSYLHNRSTRDLAREKGQSAKVMNDEAMKFLDTLEEILSKSGITPESYSQRVNRETSTWSENVDNVINGAINIDTHIRVMDTPKVFELIGAKSLPVYMDAGKILRIFNKHPAITPEIIKQIPTAISDPIAIFKSAAHPNDSIVVMTEVIDEDGGTVVVPVQLNRRQDSYQINRIASIYARKDDKTGKVRNDWFISQINNGNLMYVNTAKSSQQSNQTGLQLPVGSFAGNLKRSIPNEHDLAKLISRDTETYSPNNSFITQQALEQFDQLVTHATGNIILGNKFDLRYVGSSEGGSAFGYGAYFEQSREVAETYRRYGLPEEARGVLHIYTTDGLDFSDTDFIYGFRKSKKDKEKASSEFLNLDPLLRETLNDAYSYITNYVVIQGRSSYSWNEVKPIVIHRLEWVRQQAIKYLASHRSDRISKEKSDWEHTLNTTDKKIQLLDKIKDFEYVGRKNGNIYNFEIPEDYELLDWDESLEYQSKEITPIIMKIVDTINNNPAELIAYGFAQGSKKPKIAQERLVRVISSIMKKHKGYFIDSYEFRALPEYKRLKSILHDENVIDNLRYAINAHSPNIDTLSATGENLYWTLVDLTGSKVNASMYLNSQGIPGHRFLDEGSREEGEGTHNFVIWNMDKVRMIGMTPDSDKEARDYFDKHRDRQLELFDGNSEQYNQSITSDSSFVTPQQLERYDQLMYHGTGNILLGNKFNLQYIGTGEGSQVWGYGAYLAQVRDTSEWYRTKGLSKHDKADILITTVHSKSAHTEDEIGNMVYSAVLDTGLKLGDIRSAYDTASKASRLTSVLIRQNDPKILSNLSNIAKFFAKQFEYNKNFKSQNIWHSLLSDIFPINITHKTAKKGNIYFVDGPEDFELLDCDATMLEQPQQILEKLKRARLYINDNETGKQLYERLSEKFGGDKEASMKLNEAGIPGHRYLDAGSRDDKNGTYNFVIWNTDTLRLLGISEDSDAEAQEYYRAEDYNNAYLDSLDNDSDFIDYSDRDYERELDDYADGLLDVQDYDGFDEIHYPSRQPMPEHFNQQINAWQDTVSKVLSKDIPDFAYLKMIGTPKVLQLAGLRPLPIYMRAKKMHLIRDKHHTIGHEILSQIPYALADPIAVFKDSRRAGHKTIVVMTDIVDKNGATVIVPIFMNERANYFKRKNYRINRVASVYAVIKTDMITKSTRPKNSWFIKEVEEGNLLYLNKQKAAAWEERTGRHLPIENTATSFLTENDLAEFTTTSEAPDTPPMLWLWDDVEGISGEELRAVEAKLLQKDEHNDVLENETSNEQYHQIIGRIGAQKLDELEGVTTRMDNLRRAQYMDFKGKDARAIKRTTGWELAPDGKWRYELDDTHYDLVEKIKEFKKHNLKSPTLLDLWGEDNEVLKAYPTLKSIKVLFGSFRGMTKGVYDSQTNEITINRDYKNDNKNLSSILLHEVQHAIQYIEGFAQGGSYKFLAPAFRVFYLNNRLIEQLDKKWNCILITTS